MNISAKINCPDCGKELNCNMMLSGKQVDQYYEDEHKKYIMLNEIYNKGMVSLWQVLKIISEEKAKYREQFKKGSEDGICHEVNNILLRNEIEKLEQLQRILIDKLGGER